MRDSDETHPGRRGAHPARRARVAITGATAVLCLSVAACSGTAATGSAARPHSTRRATPATPTAQVTISPSNGSTDAKPDAGVTVTASHGKLSTVTVRSGGTTVPGALNAAGTVWHSTWTLATSAHYRVVATATATDGKTVTQTSSFRTLTPSSTFQVQIYEGYQQTYGVGMPIMLTFSQPVTRRAAVERALVLKTSKPVVGAWYWDGNERLDFRPQNYWPQHTKVDFIGHFNGLAVAPGVYGTANLTQQFNIGDSLIVVASTRTHYMHVYYRNKLFADWPISTGAPGDATANGTYLTVDKHNPTLMSGTGYTNFPVPWAVRFTFSGNYIHDAYWSVSQQGIVNVSHGCVNVAPAHAEVYYKMAIPGDPVTIIGSPSSGKWDDGWTEWFLSWNQVLHGSALHLAVQAGPNGSTFVSPASVATTVSTSTLQGSKPGNYLAG